MFQIAIDGHSSCGKSTLARALARELGYIYIDSGAMYRAVTLFFLENRVDLYDQQQIMDNLHKLEVSFVLAEAGNRTLLNGRDVEDRIREMDVAAKVSPVATIPEVRRKMVKRQRELAQNQGVVMDGRDIGSVVFPKAALKIFLTATVDRRVERRQRQLLEQGHVIDYEDILHNLYERDYIDSTRSDSPLMKAPDAIVIDNSNLSPEEQLAICALLARHRLFHV
ncbi:(d)CMP kinase [Haliscomenobacter hydrossis]|uniref:Cytidylate kinase n=1 Tax=Haliscomenobacter hydrossis (strain ATCC 27775 / DSM 1100 / LMG 10767 / O) TaxID=760192 RepID=F4KTT1_HALH1|nr:(d)CMP kinase [Haliscomenobacter hydrossis]AEE48075.1 Cytidylate kinase [Haliscomenobacter hydrossis DSM 1100]